MASVRYRGLLLIADGLGDLPIPGLGGRTPLEAAYTPNFDRLAAAGRYGLIDPIAPGVTPNTDSGSGMLLGLPAKQAGRLRRGPVEAAGTGRLLRDGEIAARANLATVTASQNGLLVTDRRAGRISEGVEDLLEMLDGLDLGGGVQVEVQPTEQHRAVLLMSGPELDPSISDTDPGDGPLPLPLLRCRALAPAAAGTADKVNRFVAEAFRQLEPHPLNRERAKAGEPPANGVITRGAGAAIELDNRVRRLGLSAALVSGCNTVCGLGRLFGFEVRSDARFTATPETDIEAKIAAALDALDRHDIVFLHLKATDIFGHDRNPTGKRDVIERLDAALAPVLQREIVIACAADHTTDSNTGFHTPDPVPALLCGAKAERLADGVKFGEEACRSGTMERQDSAAFLARVLAAMGIDPAGTAAPL